MTERMDIALPSETAVAGVHSEESAVVELSIDETNILRAKLGLKPLRLKGGPIDDGRTARTAYHKPAENAADLSLAQRRIEEAKTRRQAQKGMERLATEGKEERDTSSALEWATKMRTRQPDDIKLEKRGDISSLNDQIQDDLLVAHSLQEFSNNGDFNETILTLRDESILKYDENGSFIVGIKDRSENVLENVNLTDDRKARDNLRKKRRLELGAGHAGGYAGWDDDEFDELGGFGLNATGLRQHASRADSLVAGTRVCRLADLMQETAHEGSSSNTEGILFATQQSVEMQLTPDVAALISNRTSSDFLTLDQTEEQQQLSTKEGKRRHKLLQKEAKLFKKLKKQEKYSKQKQFRHANTKQDEDEAEVEGTESTEITNGPLASTLLTELEATAVDKVSSIHHRGDRKRQRVDDCVDPDIKDWDSTIEKEQSVHAIRRQKFDDVMEKGNLRTKEAFSITPKQSSDQICKSVVEDVPVGEEDDSILHAALLKAQRLKRLKEMHTKNIELCETANNKLSGSNDVAYQLLSSLESIDRVAEKSVLNRSEGDGSLTFEFNQSREFSHALRAKSEIAKRMAGRSFISSGVTFGAKKAEAGNDVTRIPSRERMDETETVIDDIAIDSEEIPSDDEVGGFGTSNTLDRGLAGALSLLRSTGDITGKHAGKEDMCGRAKDERTYEDYEPLNLKDIVKIDLKSANARDLEFANREIKLDYRDEHGRLLTRKEAWRNLCYQFHGYGSSYKNEEKRMKQVVQERSERAKQNEMLDRGTLGALKATQKATGKAFILHKKI